VVKNFLYQSSEIFYRIEGKGWPVLLIHGFAEDQTIWDAQTAYLEKNFRVLVPDLPGSGLSGAIPDMSMEGIADCLKKLLEIEVPPDSPEGPGGIVVIGHSMGGYILLALAERYPDLVKALGLFHSTAYPDSEEKKMARRKGIEFIGKYGSSAFIQQATPALFSERFKNQSPGIVAGLIQRYGNFNPESLITYYTQMMNRPDRTDLLKKISKPVLFVMGKEDKAVPLDQGLQQSHMPRLSYIHILENSGHMGMLEQSLDSSILLKDFCSRDLRN
jgi:pimeloyl-ACP methyl ester carboxylesterase